MRHFSLKYLFFLTCAVDVAITGDEDDAHGEDSEGVLVVQPEHHVVRPGVLDLGLPVDQLLRVLEEVVHLVSLESPDKSQRSTLRAIGGKITPEINLLFKQSVLTLGSDSGLHPDMRCIALEDFLSSY